MTVKKVRSKKVAEESSYRLDDKAKTSVGRRRSIVKKNMVPKDFLMPLQRELETYYPIRSIDGDILAGVMLEPVERNNVLLIAVHGFLAHKNHVIIRQACTDLCRMGYNTYRFDLSGNGESEGRFEDAVPTKLQRDVLSVIEHFRQSKRFDHIILLGHSFGGTLVTIAASRTVVQGLVTIAAATHPERFELTLNNTQREQLRSVGFTILVVHKSVGEVPFTLTERFVSESKEMRPLDTVESIHCSTLIIHGTEDRRVPLDDSYGLMERVRQRDLFVLGGADHNITNPVHLDAMILQIGEWVCRIIGSERKKI